MRNARACLFFSSGHGQVSRAGPIQPGRRLDGGCGRPAGPARKPLWPWPQSSCVPVVSRFLTSRMSRKETTLRRHPGAGVKGKYRAVMSACTVWQKPTSPDITVRPAQDNAGPNGFESACGWVYFVGGNFGAMQACCFRRAAVRVTLRGSVWVGSRLVGAVRAGSLCKGCCLGLVFDLGVLCWEGCCIWPKTIKQLNSGNCLDGSCLVRTPCRH